MERKEHITVCVCTFKRPDLLAKLLGDLEEQDTQGLFDYSVVVVDNDSGESARHVVKSFATRSKLITHYYVEPEQNIARARNRAVAHAHDGDFVAFIDDDESPPNNWLLCMRDTLSKYAGDGVLGPVRPVFTVAPPAWTIKAGFFDRPGYRKTGSIVHWSRTGTGNVLLRRSLLDEITGPFREEFGSGGEDQDFFRRADDIGKIFVWCQEAIVHEVIPVERTRLCFQLRRALLRGKTSLVGPSGGSFGILKSASACCVYIIALPVLLLISWPLFAKYLIKSLDHIGKLTAACGIDLIKTKYVLD